MNNSIERGRQFYRRVRQVLSLKTRSFKKIIVSRKKRSFSINCGQRLSLITWDRRLRWRPGLAQWCHLANDNEACGGDQVQLGVARSLKSRHVDLGLYFAWVTTREDWAL